MLTPRRSVTVASTALAFALAPAAQAHAGPLGSLAGGSGSTATAAISPSLLNQLSTITGLPVGQVTPIVDGLLAGGVTPDVLTNVLPELTSAVANPADPTALVQDLLAQGVATASIVSLVDGLLGSVADPTGAVNAVIAQLLAVGLPADTTALSGVLAALQGGALPTGSLLGPVAGVLDALAVNQALPADVRGTLAGLSTTVKAAGDGVLPTDVLEQVSGVLGAVGGALGPSSSTGGLLGGLAGLLPPKSSTTTTTQTKPGVTTTTTPGATPGAPVRRGTLNLKDLTATVSSLKVDKARRVARVKVSCPARSFVPCTVKTAASVDGLRSGKAVKTTLKAGRSKVVSFKLPATKARKLGRRGGKLSVRAVTSYAGYQLGTARKAVTVKKAAKRR